MINIRQHSSTEYFVGDRAQARAYTKKAREPLNQGALSLMNLNFQCL